MTPEQTKAAQVLEAAIVIEEVCNEIKDMLVSKNKAYGNSVIDPLRIFSKADPTEQINVRIDDKLSRIKNGIGNDNEDPEKDLIGYLIMKRVRKKLVEKKSIV